MYLFRLDLLYVCISYKLNMLLLCGDVAILVKQYYVSLHSITNMWIARKQSNCFKTKSKIEMCGRENQPKIIQHFAILKTVEHFTWKTIWCCSCWFYLLWLQNRRNQLSCLVYVGWYMCAELLKCTSHTCKFQWQLFKCCKVWKASAKKCKYCVCLTLFFDSLAFACVSVCCFSCHCIGTCILFYVNMSVNAYTSIPIVLKWIELHGSEQI